MEKYLEQIREAVTEEDLNGIIETAAFDDTLTHAQYSRLYSTAIAKFYTI